MHSGKRRVLTIAAIFCVLLLLVGVLFIFSDRIRTQGMAAAAGQLQQCARENDLIACARGPIQRLLEMKSGGEIMQMLSDTLSPTQCHSVGHIVGQEVYKQFKNVEPALAQCSSACFSACIHGAIGEAFVEEAGVDQSVDPEHLSVQEIESIGKKLCVTGSTCHGAGHALFLQSAEIDPAIQVCRSIAPSGLQEPCFGGVYMEYQQELTSTSVWQGALDLPPLTSESLVSFCKRSSPEEIAACFKYFTPIAVDTLGGDGSASSTLVAFGQIRKICESYSDANMRHSCMFGYGAYRYQYALTDPATAVQICERFSQTEDESACVSGMVSRAGEYEKPDKVRAFCATIPEESVRTTCFESISSQQSE